MSSWVGTGAESEAEINLTPMSVEAPMIKEDLSETKSAAVESFEMPTHLDQNEVLQADSEGLDTPLALDGPGCVDQYPTLLINFMVTLIVVMASLLIASAVYIIYQRKQNQKKKVAEFATKDFDAVVENESPFPEEAKEAEGQGEGG